MTSNYCPRIYHGLTLNRINNSGLNFAACCWASNTINDTLDFDHHKLIELRQQNKRNILPRSHCQQCLIQEQVGQQSMRQGYLAQHGTESYDSSVKYLDINIDYACNLACVTCGPDYSTTWRNELKIKGANVRPDIDNFIATQLSKIDLTQLEEIRIWGGEPFLTRTHQQILEHVAAVADPASIRLMYNTNGTQKINDSTKQLLEKFKFVRICFSIDDTDTRYEYLRWPAKWDHTQQTLKWWKENLPHNSMLSVTVTASILNVLTLDSVYQWCRENFSHSKFGDEIEIFVHQAFGDYGLDAMPDAMIQEFKSLRNYCQPWIQNLDILGKNQARLPNVVNALRELNARRNIDFKSVLPKVAELIGY